MPTTPVLPPSPSRSPRRRPALHERTQSQTNEYSPPSPPNVRLVNDQEDVDYRATFPYPTKPEQVLLPKPGKGQGWALDVSETPRSPSLATTTTTVHPDDGRWSVRTASHGWEQSSSVERTRSSSQVWGEDPTSSRSSVTQSFLFTEEQNDRHGSTRSVTLLAEDEGGGVIEAEKGKAAATGSAAEEEDDEVIVLPLVRSTVKTVPPDPSSPERRSFQFDDIDNASLADDPEDLTSTPNVVPIGLPSSPNFVPLDSSSPNLIPIGSSSPNLSVKRSNSSIATSGSNSQGTVIRSYNRAILWNLSMLSGDGTDSQLGSFRSSPPEPLGSFRSSPPEPLRSSPPEPVLRSDRSASSFALPSVAAESRRSRSATTSTRSVTSASDLPVTIETATQVQYATIRAASSSGSWAESADPSLIPRPLWSMDRSGRWNPRLSTVPSRWSAERSPTESGSLPGPSEALPSRLGDNNQTTSTVWLVEESAGGRGDDDERLDSLSNLPRSALHRGPSARVGQRPESRSSLRRWGSNSSLMLSTLPNWVRLYYRSDGQMFPNSALSLIDISPPSSRPPSSRPPSSSRPTSPNVVVTRVPTTLSRPRTRPRENPRRIEPPPAAKDPADPRSHWRPNPHGEPTALSEPVPLDGGRNTWSPHLHPDRQNQNPRNTWLAPSVDSTLEPFWGRRNLQVYSFCVGFIFPPGKCTPGYRSSRYGEWRESDRKIPTAWFIAAFLPLPPEPLPSDLEAGTRISAMDLRIQNRVLNDEKRRYENALWWRRLNRFMIPPGIMIFIVIVSSCQSCKAGFEGPPTTSSLFSGSTNKIKKRKKKLVLTRGYAADYPRRRGDKGGLLIFSTINLPTSFYDREEERKQMK